MEKVTYSNAIKNYVESYDLENHEVWNNTQGQIVEVRKYIREHYLKQQKYRCAYCKIEKKETHGLCWDIEHILPKIHFPEYLFEPENLAVACKECNTPKDDHVILIGNPTAKYPSKSEKYRIIHPHFDNYDEHIEVSVVSGKRLYRILDNKKGKETYILCNLSRFDYKFSEWDSFDHAIVQEFSRFLDSCSIDATPDEIKRQLGHLKFIERH